MISSEGGAFIKRPIKDTDYVDAIGPWPYSTLPADSETISALRTRLENEHIVSFSACARPDQPVEHSLWQTIDFEVLPLKPHFVHRPQLPSPTRSAKTRASLSKARRYWQTEIVPPSLPMMESFAHWHDALNQRKDMSLFTRLPPGHFHQLITLPGCQLMTALKHGQTAAAVILMISGDEVHCHAQAGATEAYTHRAFYALYEAILQHWGRTHTIYLGGVPGGPDGPGIERFKRRFANDTSEITMVRTLLNPELSAQLAQTRGDSKWFPPYRSRIE